MIKSFNAISRYVELVPTSIDWQV